jgi:diguanylate cyclase (GGDEF)-like protein
MRDMARRRASFAVLLADIDHFKRLNDTFGHQAGDRALRKFGEVLRTSLRSDDRAARWGGEEFVVLLVDSHATQAADWVERMRARLAAELAEGDVPAFTVSFGIADSAMAKEPPPLLRIADTALYLAKSQGRDRGVIGRPDFALEPDAPERNEDGVLDREDTTTQPTLGQL